MHAEIRLQTVLPSDHQLHLVVPPEFPAGEVEVSLRSKVPFSDQAPGMSPKGISDLHDLFSYLDHMPPGSRSKEEIDRYVAEERASWE